MNENREWFQNRTRKEKNDSECCERRKEERKLFLALIVYISAARKSVILTSEKKEKKFFSKSNIFFLYKSVYVRWARDKSKYLIEIRKFFLLNKMTKVDWRRKSEKKILGSVQILRNIEIRYFLIGILFFMGIAQNKLHKNPLSSTTEVNLIQKKKNFWIWHRKPKNQTELIKRSR